MKLTKPQRQRLETYWLFHQRPPRRADQIKRIAPQMAMLGLLAAAAMAMAFLTGGAASIIWFVLFGYIAGMATAAFAVVYTKFSLWPMIEAITDWERVEDLRRENGT